MRPVTFFFCIACAVIAQAMTVERNVDVVIYGATPGGIAAAIQAKRMGRSVVVIEPSTRIGGLTTGGLGCTDIGAKWAYGGIAREFYRDVKRYYADDANWKWQKRDEYDYRGIEGGYPKHAEEMWLFEPSAALAILERWERENRLDIVRGARLNRGPGGVKVREGRITEFRTMDGTVYRGKVFVDATYEGDLLAAAGVSYAVGREDNATYGETLNGAQPMVACGYHRFEKGVDPYVRKGDPASGLLPGIDPEPMGTLGKGDRRVQAYCYRMCLTDKPENRIPFVKPAGYDERDYELLFRNYECGAEAHGMPWLNSAMPNRKTDTNNRKGFSTDFIGRNWDYPEASYAERERIEREHLHYQQGLMWTLANHPRIPEKVRAEVSRWGVCKDEFRESAGWPTQLYVREARRMIGEYVMTERDCRGERIAPNPVALGSYQMDSHNVRRYVGGDGFVQNEGDVEAHLVKHPYGIGYGAIVPKRGDCANLLVPVCLSASHIAFGSIRMEPVFFALGQVAGTAAAQAIAAGCAVQDIPYASLRERLLADGQVLE